MQDNPSLATSLPHNNRIHSNTTKKWDPLQALNNLNYSFFDETLLKKMIAKATVDERTNFHAFITLIKNIKERATKNLESTIDRLTKLLLAYEETAKPFLNPWRKLFVTILNQEIAILYSEKHKADEKNNNASKQNSLESTVKHLVCSFNLGNKMAGLRLAAISYFPSEAKLIEKYNIALPQLTNSLAHNLFLKIFSADVSNELELINLLYIAMDDIQNRGYLFYHPRVLFNNIEDLLKISRNHSESILHNPEKILFSTISFMLTQNISASTATEYKSPKNTTPQSIEKPEIQKNNLDHWYSLADREISIYANKTQDISEKKLLLQINFEASLTYILKTKASLLESDMSETNTPSKKADFILYDVLFNTSPINNKAAHQLFYFLLTPDLGVDIIKLDFFINLLSHMKLKQFNSLLNHFTIQHFYNISEKDPTLYSNMKNHLSSTSFQDFLKIKFPMSNKIETITMNELHKLIQEENLTSWSQSFSLKTYHFLTSSNESSTFLVDATPRSTKIPKSSSSFNIIRDLGGIQNRTMLRTSSNTDDDFKEYEENLDINFDEPPKNDAEQYNNSNSTDASYKQPPTI